MSRSASRTMYSINGVSTFGSDEVILLPLIIRYGELGPTPEARLQRLRTLVDLTERQPGEIWERAVDLTVGEASELLKSVGAVNLVEWENQIPYVRKLSGGYVLVGLSELLSEVPDQSERETYADTPYGPRLYEHQLRNLGAAVISLMQEYLQYKE